MSWAAQADAILDGIAETGLITAAVVAATWRVGVDPDATAGLTAAALALYAEPKDLLTGPLYPVATDRDLLITAADIATDTGDHAAAVRVLTDEVMRALAVAIAAIEAANRELSKTGHEAPARKALAKASHEAADCEVALEMLAGMAKRLGDALDGLERVPDDLLSVYDLAYEHRRQGGTFPLQPDFLTGAAV